MIAAIPWVNALYPLAGVALGFGVVALSERRAPSLSWDGRRRWEMARDALDQQKGPRT